MPEDPGKLEESAKAKPPSGDVSESIWKFVNPLWMWRVRPKDCDCNGYRALCPGLLYMPGCLVLISFHAMTIGTFVGLVLFKGYRNTYLWSLVPLAPVWLFLCGADIKFRLQGANKDQRNVFDNSVINWIGIITFIPSLIVSIVMFISFIITMVQGGCSGSSSMGAVELNNGDRYELLLKAARQSDDQSLDAKYRLKWAYDCMRDYRRAESITDDITKEIGESSDILFDQSCYVGKQGRYEQALELAERGLKDKPDSLRGLMVKALWLHKLGREGEAKKIQTDLEINDLGNPQHNVYWLCNSYLTAMQGDVKALEHSIRQALRSDIGHWAYNCLQRDETFDRFRSERWFIDHVGRTAVESKE